MNRREMEALKKIYRYVTDIAIIAVLAFIYERYWSEYLNVLMDRRFLGKGNYMMVITYLITAICFLYIFGGFKIGYYNKMNVWLSQILAIIIINFIQNFLVILVVGAVGVIGAILYNIFFMTLWQIGVVSCIAFVTLNMYTHIFPPYKMLQIYGTHENLLVSKMNSRSDKYKVCEQIFYKEDFQTICQKIDMYDAVLINDIPSQIKNRILKYCFEKSVRVYFNPKISDILVKSSEELNLFDTPLFLIRNIGPGIIQRMIKRAGDIIFSVVMIIVTSPIMLITAACIKGYDGGPALFVQERYTINWKVFKIYKFRSMIVDAEKDGKPKPATEQDDRITPIGKFIRKTRIDELPQLFNILFGDMSLVGPRPERVEHVDKYCETVPEFAFRLKVKGGLTGYAQVYGKYNTTAYDKLKLDLLYIQNYSILMDIKIIIMTVKVVFMRESTEGFTTEESKKMNQNQR